MGSWGIPLKYTIEIIQLKYHLTNINLKFVFLDQDNNNKVYRHKCKESELKN